MKWQQWPPKTIGPRTIWDLILGPVVSLPLNVVEFPDRGAYALENMYTSHKPPSTSGYELRDDEVQVGVAHCGH